VGNTVYDNNNDGTAAIDIAQLAIGNGILIAGGNDNVVERNLVYDHDIVGIGVIPLPEKVINPDNPDAINFDARRNRVIGNVVRQSRAADLALVTSITDPKDAGRNCFSRNRVTSSLPVGLQRLLPCGKPASKAFECWSRETFLLIGMMMAGTCQEAISKIEEPAREMTTEATPADILSASSFI